MSNVLDPFLISHATKSRAARPRRDGRERVSPHLEVALELGNGGVALARIGRVPAVLQQLEAAQNARGA